MFLFSLIVSCVILIVLILKYMLKLEFSILEIVRSKKFLKLFSIYLFTTIILGIASQNFAKLVRYNKALGYPIYHRIYNPYMIIKWFFKYKETHPNILNKALQIPSLILIIVSIIIFIRILKKSGNKDTHGSARWIKNSELEKLGFLEKKHSVKDGVILGRVKTMFGEKTIINKDNTHISLIAPTRSGKGVGVIIPTLLTWKGSTLVLDPKGENYSLTGGYRQKVLGHKVLKFAPFATDGTISYNPLSAIRKGSIHEFTDVEVITSILVDNGKDAELDHWASGAKILLNGLILHALYTIEDRVATLGDVLDITSNPLNPLVKELEKIIGEEDEDENILPPKYNYTKNSKTGREFIFKDFYDTETMQGVPKGVHPVVARMCAKMLGTPDKERGSIISTAETKLGLFQNPIIRKNTKKIDFKISDLMNYKEPVDLFLVIQPEQIKLIAPFVRLLLTQVVGTLCPDMNHDDPDRPVHKHKMLMLLDEFPAFGKVPILEKAIAYVAGYGMRLMIIGQSLSQFKQVYGRDLSLLDNCKTAVFYTPSPIDTETPKIISNLLGKETIKVRNTSQKMGEILGGSISNNYQGRDLMTEEEVRNKLGSKRNIISFGGEYPVQGWKIRFYEEPYFLNKTNKNKKYRGVKTNTLYPEKKVESKEQ